MFVRYSSIITILLLFSGHSGSFAQKSSSGDSLLNAIIREKDPEVRTDRLITLAEELIRLSDKSSSIYAERAYKTADSINSKALMAKAALTAGTAFRLNNNYSKSASYLMLAAEQYTVLNDIRKKGNSLGQLSETYRASGELPQAEKYLFQALKIFSKLNDTLNLAITYNRLAATAYEQYYNDPVFLGIFERSIKDPVVFRKTIDSVPVLRKRYLLLNHYIHQAMAFSGTTEELKNNRISTLIIQAALEGTRMHYETASRLFYPIIDSIQNSDQQNDLPLALYNLSINLAGAGKLDEAEHFALESYRLALKKDIKIYIILSAKALHEIYVAKGDYQNAYKFLDLFIGLRRQNYNADVDLKLNSVRFAHEIKNRELQISNRDTRIRIIVFSFSFISITIIFFTIVLFFKNKKLSLLNRSLQESNQVISEQNKQLVKLNTERNIFFSIIAHDLRNPLSGFRSLTELMASGMSNMSHAEISNALNLLKSSADKIYELLENLLQWSRMQNGLITYTPERLNVADMLVDCAGLLEGAATAKNIIIRVLVTPDCSASGDRKMLETVIRNLTSNAIKFSHPNNEIRLRCSVNKDTITVSVEDDGAGMTEETLASLFAHDQAKQAKGTHGESGTGLGLILCRDFLSKHNSELNIHSEAGKGSIFSFKLNVSTE